MMNFPVAIVDGAEIVAVHYSPVAFETTDGVKHPQDAWSAWDVSDWAEKAPGWRLLPVVDSPPVITEWQALERLPIPDWPIMDAVVAVAYRVFDRTAAEVVEMRRAGLLAKLRATDSRMPRALEDLLTDLRDHEPERYDRQPEPVRALHAERLAIRASLAGL